MAVADGPQTPEIPARGWPPAHGDRAALALQLGRLTADGFSVTVCVGGEGAALRMVEVLEEEGLDSRFERDEAALARPGVHVAVSQLDQGFVVPAAQRRGADGARHDRQAPRAPSAEGKGAPDRRVLRRSCRGGLRRAPPARSGPLRRNRHAHRQRRLA